MAHTLLGHMALGYQLLWNQQRQLCAVQLVIDPQGQGVPDIAPLLVELKNTWPNHAPTLLLSSTSTALLAVLLDQTPSDGPWIEVSEAFLTEPDIIMRVRQASQRGLKLVWRGESGARPGATRGAWFHTTMLTLSTQETLMGLHASLKKQGAGTAALRSPVMAGQIYADIASHVLTEHCLDEQGAWAVAGWPVDDVLHSYRHEKIQPDQRLIHQLLQAVGANVSMEAIESILCEEPLLVYRFLRFANSAALGLRSEISSLRQGLLVLGLVTLKNWLQEQLPHASSSLNLQPVRSAMVLRARVMSQLFDAGDNDELRRNMYLCGLLSQIDLFLNEPIEAALQRIPHGENISAALLHGNGSYAPFLHMAIALESGDPHAALRACERYEFNLADVNRTLLRTLAMPQPHPARK